jgi:hypothetical protein
LKTIIYLPLDERPCNYMYPQYLASMTDLKFLVPDRSMLGNKKRAANVEAVGEWLSEQAVQADYLLVSIDMLVYGGIVPSRLHTLPLEVCLERLHVLRSIKRNHPELRIFAFNLITRAPAYSSSEEEPDYYANYGRELYEMGWFKDKAEREGLEPEEHTRLSELSEVIPAHILEEFATRRLHNAAINAFTIDLVEEGVIDYLIIPLDDNSKFGYTSAEQRRVAAQVERLDLLDRIAIYPGADEIGCTLFTRIFCEIKSYIPLIHLRYSSTNGPFCIPKYEDRSLNESIKHHITTAGALVCDNMEQPDIHLMVHSPPVGQADMGETMDAYEDRHRSYYSESNSREFVQAIKHYISQGKLVALADVALCNGGDHTLMRLLAKQNLMQGIACYAAWNTSGNALGTVISHAVIEAYNRSQIEDSSSFHERSRAYYYYRLIEDWAYQSVVRQDVSRNDLPLLNADDFNLSHVQEQVEFAIEHQLHAFVERYMTEIELKVTDVYLPWNRLFEVGFQLQEFKEN